MGKKGLANRCKESLANALSLPEDVLMDLEKIIIYGSKRIVVENIKTVTEFCEECIRIETLDESVLLTGKRFKIDEINQEHVVIRGGIEKVEFLSKGE